MTKLCRACHDRPVADDRFVCADCIDTLHGDLAAIPGDVHELTVELTRQSTKGSNAYGRSTDAHLIVNLAAGDLLDELRALLVGQIRELTFDDMSRQPEDTWDVMCLWLTVNEVSIAMREGGGEFCRELGRIRAKARRLIDIPLEKTFIGQCGCGTDMYAARNTPDDRGHRAETWHQCKGCGTKYGVEECIANREQVARDYRFTAAEVELLTAGRVKAGRVRKWRHRGQIETDMAGRVRFGDVLDLEARRERKQA